MCVCVCWLGGPSVKRENSTKEGGHLHVWESKYETSGPKQNEEVIGTQGWPGTQC